MKRRQPLASKNFLTAPKRLRKDTGTENTPARPQTTNKNSEARRSGGSTAGGAGASRSNGRAPTTTPTNNSTARPQAGNGEGGQQRSGAAPTSGTAQPTEQETQGAESEDEQPDPDEDPTPRSGDSAYQTWLGSLRTSDADAIRVVGRLIRFFVPFEKIQQVFHYGALAQANDTDIVAPDDNGEFEFKLPARCAYQWKLLKNGLPVIQDLLDRHDSQFLARRLTYIRGQTRGEDTRRCKKLALELREWDPPIARKDSNDKSLRGLGHPQMAQLLLPPTEDFNDPETQQAYLKPGDGRKRFSSSVLPRLLYPEDDPLQKKGPAFLKSEFLTKLGQGLVLGGEAAVNGDCVAAGNSITNKHGIRFATLPFLGYVACQGRCAISNEPAFGAAGERGFKYKLFYNAILKTVVGIEAMGEAGEDAITNLLNWWEERVWGEDAGAENEQEDDAANDEVTGTPADVLAFYKRSIAEEDAREGAA